MLRCFAQQSLEAWTNNKLHNHDSTPLDTRTACAAPQGEGHRVVLAPVSSLSCSGEKGRECFRPGPRPAATIEKMCGSARSRDRPVPCRTSLEKRSDFGPQSSLWQCHCRRRSRPVSRQSACRGCCASLRAWVVMPRGLASGSRKAVACHSNHPAGAAHEPGNFGTLSTLSLLSGSSEGHIILLQEGVNGYRKEIL